MKVFISWSREPSRAIARALSEWLGGLVQAAEPWVSDDEIGSGTRWRDEIASVLNDTDFGIICLTRASQHNPWLMFEAGALAKHLSSARVIPLYIDLDAAEVTGPLADWQGRSLDREGMWRVVHDINEATPRPVAKESLRRLFDKMWPDFEAEIAAAKAQVPEPEQPRRSAEDMLEEIVDRVRRLERPQTAALDYVQWVNTLGSVITDLPSETFAPGEHSNTVRYLIHPQLRTKLRDRLGTIPAGEERLEHRTTDESNGDSP